jgi:hypothetical protein
MNEATTENEKELENLEENGQGFFFNFLKFSKQILFSNIKNVFNFK